MSTTTNDPSSPRHHDVLSLKILAELLRCPVTHESLQLTADGTAIVSAESGREWSCTDFVPHLFANHHTTRYGSEHYSHDLVPQALDLIEATNGYVLNLSAGGSRTWFPNVVEVEAGRFRNTDVIADAHELPFRDGVFSACIAMNSFEHYHTPARVAQEILRVLAPGGQVLVQAAFLQPLHEAPFHFFNATSFGVEKWFEGFVDKKITTPWNFNPVFALSWMVSELEFGLREEGKVLEAEALVGLSVADLLEFWRMPNRRDGSGWWAFFAASPALQGRLAAGIELSARKPRS